MRRQPKRRENECELFGMVPLKSLFEYIYIILMKKLKAFITI